MRSCYAGKVYIRNKDGSEELYDHATDPAESRDLSKSSEAADVLERFREQMKRIDQQAVAVEDSRPAGSSRIAQSGETSAATSRVGATSQWPGRTTALLTPATNWRPATRAELSRLTA